MCSPTRASLLTGRNHHRIGNGQIAELANDWDGYAGRDPQEQRAGRRGAASTTATRPAAWGKWHNTPGDGDDRGGAVRQLADRARASSTSTASWPARRRSTSRTWCATPPACCRRGRPEEGYHLSEDLADDAIGWLHRHQAFEPDKPFFMYWASGCLHGPHHVMKEWADKYAGKFDDGWDAYRERVFDARQGEGLDPAGRRADPARPDRCRPGTTSRRSEKPFQRRLMEVAAGFAEHVDVQVGRLVDEIDALGYGENTLIFYIWGDNGSSGEGQNGTISELLAQNGIPTTVDMHIKALDELGGLDVLGTPKVDNQYHAGWAWAGSTPYKGMKLLASHLGGTRNPMAVRWPAKITPDATPRTQFHHCNDVVPTIYEVVGITPPRVVNGVPQDPIDGVSFAYTFDDPTAEGRLRTQYFEVMGSRAIYHDGWMASAIGPRLPWVPGLPPGIRDWTPDQDTWELYNLDEDWSQAHDLAAADAREARADEGDCSRSRPRGTASPDRRRAVDPDPAPRTADLAALPRVELHRRHHPHARVLRTGARQPSQPRHHRRRHPGRRQRRALRARRRTAAASPATSTTASSATSTTSSSSCAPRSAPSEQLPAGQATIEVETDVRRAQARRTARHHDDASTATASPTGRCRSAPRCCSPPTTASTSASASARPSRWTTTTGRRSRSTAPSMKCTSDI